MTYEKPVTEFGGDIVLTGPVQQTLKCGEDIPRNCVGMRFIGLLGTVTASINGGPSRTVLNNDVISGCEIRSITLSVSAASAVTVQAVGTGD
jgi:hypothetical protein